MKIIDKLSDYKKQGKIFYSFEYFPPKTDFGLQNLYSRLNRMAALNPAFIDITWGAGGSTADLTLEMSQTIQKYFGVNVLMHLTCTNMPKAEIKKVLTTAKEAGISNILALRGDPPEGNGSWEKCQDGFNFAKDLVKFAKEEFADHFCIGVAGYPEGHTETLDLDLGIKHLKEKVDAGADFVITQMFYDVDAFLKFRDRAVKAGIKVPIIPGILPIHNYSRFLKFTKFANVSVPNEIISELETIKSDDNLVLEFGVKQAGKMSKRLIEEGVDGLHFYTLNLESSVKNILTELGLSNAGGTAKHLPWRQSSDTVRNSSEEIRPIYWSNRPISYLARTQGWDDFPNGRWGDSSSPTFGELNTYHLVRHTSKNEKINEQRRKLWGTPQDLKDIEQTFVKYCNGEINMLPWCEFPLALESSSINNQLKQLNLKGYLTINSQPKVNGAKSEDNIYGWGNPGGRVYQKAYLEFFSSKENLDLLLKKLSDFPSYTLQAVNASGDFISNLKTNEVTAVTWGVFPEKEIVQPTVVDSESFKIWKDEAFNLWLNEWAIIYDKNSPSYNAIKEIHDTYYLINIVDHDFVEGDIFKIFS